MDWIGLNWIGLEWNGMEENRMDHVLILSCVTNICGYVY